MMITTKSLFTFLALCLLALSAAIGSPIVAESRRVRRQSPFAITAQSDGFQVYRDGFSRDFTPYQLAGGYSGFRYGFY